MPLSALIVDDEPLARQELAYLLEAAGDVDVVAQGSNGIEAVELIRRHHPDVVFLDVQMPALDGFAVLKKLLTLDKSTPLPHVVFATAFDKYAVRAFEVNAVDYLLKPFDEKRLVRTLTKLRTLVQLRSLPPAPDAALPADAASPQPASYAAEAISSTEQKLNELRRMVGESRRLEASRQADNTTPDSAKAAAARTGKIVVRTGGRLVLVDQRDICFASVNEGVIAISSTTIEGEGATRTLEELQDQLDPAHFWRVHRGFLVNIQHIREVVPWFKGSYQLRMDDKRGTEIPVSRTQTRRLRDLFNL